MANIRLIKGRIKSAKNIAQITKAMELVSAAKMKKAQAQALAGKLYAQKIFEMVVVLASRTISAKHPLLQKPKHLAGRRLVILISSNKGLCGGLNTNLFRFFSQHYHASKNFDAVTAGKKGASFLSHFGGSLKADFSNSSSFVAEVPAITELVTREYTAGLYDGVDLIYNEFVNVVKQVPKRKTILPLTVESLETPVEEHGDFLIEPSIDEVFESLLPHYLENQIRDAALQAEASEHSARMVAMRNATDNALSLVDDLTLVYNKARQEKITYEITDMITASMTVSV
ncbi:MAG TPA: ATP synthase F1 subunit gamma [Patescibacteria group bacterium]|nr:ATP synthase F1 subunit gamma [Patescibacteria group bacterium]